MNPRENAKHQQRDGSTNASPACAASPVAAQSRELAGRDQGASFRRRWHHAPAQRRARFSRSFPQYFHAPAPETALSRPKQRKPGSAVEQGGDMADLITEGDA